MSTKKYEDFICKRPGEKSNAQSSDGSDVPHIKLRFKI